MVKKLQQHFRDDLQFVFRNFPLTTAHPHALGAAVTAEYWRDVRCVPCCSAMFKRTAQLSRSRTAARQEYFSSAEVSPWACLILRTIHQIASIITGTRTAITGATTSWTMGIPFNR